MNVASTPAPKPATPSPVHRENLAGAIDRAAASTNRAWTVVQSIADGTRTGSSRLDDHVESIGKHLVVAAGHAARAGVSELVGPFGRASQEALEAARALELPAGQRMYPPRTEQSLVEYTSSLLVNVERSIGEVRDHLGIAAAPAQPTPRRDDPSTDARLMAWAKADDGDLSKLPADLKAAYADVIAKSPPPSEAPVEAELPPAGGLEGGVPADPGGEPPTADYPPAAEGAGEPPSDPPMAADPGAGAEGSGELLPPPTFEAPPAAEGAGDTPQPAA